MCCLDVVQSYSDFHSSKLYVILFLVVSVSQRKIIQIKETVHLVKSTVSCAVLFEIAVFCTHIQYVLHNYESVSN